MLKVIFTTHKFSTVSGGEVFTVAANSNRKFLRILNQSTSNWLVEFGAVNPTAGSPVVRPDVVQLPPTFEAAVPNNELRLTCADAGKSIIVLEGVEA